MQNSTADFESVEKVLKKCTKKVISKNVTEICTFFTFTHVRQTCFCTVKKIYEIPGFF